jgi:flavin reductase (DIM6/NTAB) family NADH-FMN oxidoreductase RutF
MILKTEDLKNLDRIYRLNLINSISGIKPANLIATKSRSGQDNVAIFSSVVHLGSNPPQLGFVMRPQVEPFTDTYTNILETGFYTINHVTDAFVKKAHYTSAKLKADESEFDVMAIQKQYIEDFFAPFVRSSPVKIGMKHLESISLTNACIFIIGEIVLVDVLDTSVDKKGQLDLSAHKGVGISGLNTYHGLPKIETFPYVRENEIPTFDD